MTANRILIREMLQGKLDIEEATVVATHMDACDDCRAFHHELVGDRRNKAEGADERPAPSSGESTRASTFLTTAVVLGVFLLAGVLYAVRHEGWLNGLAHRGPAPSHHCCSTP